MKQQSLMLWIPLFFILILGLVSFHNLLNNKNINIKKYNEENVLAIYLEDEQISYIPEKDSGYTLDLSKSNCTNGVELDFDYNTWSIKTNYSNYTNTDNTRVKCNLFFKERTFAEAIIDCGELSKDAGTCIKENYNLTDEIVSDDTIDNNLRYIGSDQNNYVYFNCEDYSQPTSDTCELWRIIGVMNNMKLEDSSTTNLVKLIRDESIGKYSFDNKPQGIGSSTSNYGSGNWSDARLMMLLNGGFENGNTDIYAIKGSLYYNAESGNCYAGENGNIMECDFQNTGLKNETTRNMIAQVIWNIGAIKDEQWTTVEGGLAKHWYNYERGDVAYEGRSSTWIGQIGLVYLSDYGYATGGGTTKNRENCLAKELYNWNDPDYKDCYTNNWLSVDGAQWTMNSSGLGSSYITFVVSAAPRASTWHASSIDIVKPVIYLKQSISIVSGNGSKTNPYILSIE